MRLSQSCCRCDPDGHARRRATGVVLLRNLGSPEPELLLLRL